ncbi:probable 28S ribosomal protein S25, mitochondrial [Anthonomus grandis grandis]|uniref:probable 28S ribosomal protein S25, mitochondrial n=1 Tax=Anthonomus grandis grandis TaxID=2921223 RepID=UPI0021658F43|nr:probable 28S ribosomal protein S25, mitochondrial [Anthonomus grandis grandis]
MPFMKGRAPIRRTIQYLEAGKLYLKDQIKILTINYNIHGENHQGVRDFVFWHLPQVQYKNPNVQISTFKNLTPTPFIRAFYDTGDRMLIDIDNKSKDQIYDHLVEVIGKNKEVLKAELIAKEKKDNPANFGAGCDRFCICQLPGQVPCSGVCPVPKHMRGKYIFKKDDD